jgi:hypothetical protein
MFITFETNWYLKKQMVRKTQSISKTIYISAPVAGYNLKLYDWSLLSQYVCKYLILSVRLTVARTTHPAVPINTFSLFF